MVVLYRKSLKIDKKEINYFFEFTSNGSIQSKVYNKLYIFIDETEKRKITYEIAKNKGLTPKRKKENRNPRVKHRNKFHKANIRRKGQV